MDAICANPQTDKEFATGSHDHTIKIWDAPKYGVKGTIKGHEKGVWALQYDQSGKRLISASPDHTSRIWDIKSGKCADTLRAHTHFVSIHSKPQLINPLISSISVSKQPFHLMERRQQLLALIS